MVQGLSTNKAYHQKVDQTFRKTQWMERKAQRALRKIRLFNQCNPYAQINIKELFGTDQPTAAHFVRMIEINAQLKHSILDQLYGSEKLSSSD